MALDVWFRDELANIIHSINQAGGNTAAVVHCIIEECEQQGHQPDMRELQEKLCLYEKGRQDALGEIAVALGILPQ